MIHGDRQFSTFYYFRRKGGVMRLTERFRIGVVEDIRESEGRIPGRAE